MTSADTATSSTTAATARPNPAPRVSTALTTNLPRERVEGASSRATCSVIGGASAMVCRQRRSSAIADARVEERVEQVGQEIRQQHRQRQDEHHALQHREIAEEDGV